MFEPAILNDGTHLLVHNNILQILQGRMLTYFIFKRQHVLANCTCGRWAGLYLQNHPKQLKGLHETKKNQ